MCFCAPVCPCCCRLLWDAFCEALIYLESMSLYLSQDLWYALMHCPCGSLPLSCSFTFICLSEHFEFSKINHNLASKSTEICFFCLLLCCNWETSGTVCKEVQHNFLQALTAQACLCVLAKEEHFATYHAALLGIPAMRFVCRQPSFCTTLCEKPTEKCWELAVITIKAKRNR